MKDSIKKWAQAGDPNAMVQLAEIYLTEGNVEDAKKFLTQATEKNYFPAVKRLAKIFHDEGNFPKAVTFYKKAVERADVEAMDKLVDLCPDDEEILNFVLEVIDKQYNKIYFHTNSLAKIMTFGSTRMSEYLPGQAEAIERCRIRNKILKLKAKA